MEFVAKLAGLMLLAFTAVKAAARHKAATGRKVFFNFTLKVFRVIGTPRM